MKYYDQQLELDCLSAAINNKQNLVEVMSLDSKDFYDNKCSFLFEVIKNIYN